MGMTPATMATVSMSTQAAGAVSSAAGSYYGAATSRASLEAQAAVARANARISEAAARQEITRGARDVSAMRTKMAGVKGAQRAAIAANGIDLRSNSALDVLTSTDYVTETDAATIEENAMRSAWGYRVQGGNAMSAAVGAQAGADSISPLLATTGTLLTSGGRVADSWYRYSRSEQGARD